MGIDSTLAVLKHRLNHQEQRLPITIVKQYGELPRVKCWAGQLNQVFMNLLMNAIDALELSLTDQYLEHRLLQDPDFQPQITIITERVNNTMVAVRIRDNGCGIPAGVQAQIFNPFFTTKPVGKGTGMGLAISYQIIVDRHHGHLICNSVENQGTELKLTLPIQITR
ncbi:MAG: hypothetical protein HC805_03485 [Alkalinema sp. RL_2_19]|nr:hypothetical protein [Alkalinema sp. RL_2_19]